MGTREFGWPENLDRFVVHHDKRVAVENERGFDETDGFAARDFARNSDSQGRALADAGIAVVRGNLAPDGAVIKPSAASAHLLQHRGRAVVFETIEDSKLSTHHKTYAKTKSTTHYCSELPA